MGLDGSNYSGNLYPEDRFRATVLFSDLILIGQNLSQPILILDELISSILYYMPFGNFKHFSKVIHFNQFTSF
jgi:hypothetical protein